MSLPYLRFLRPDDLHKSLVSHEQRLQQPLLAAQYLQGYHLKCPLQQVIISINDFFLSEHSLLFLVDMVTQFLESTLNLFFYLRLLVEQGLDDARENVSCLLGF